MAYTEELSAGLLRPNSSAVLDADDLSGTGVHGEYLCMARCKVWRLMFTVTTVTVGATTLEFNKRPTAGDATGETALGTLTIPAATAAGTTVYKDISPAELLAGESISFEVTSAATSGNGQYGFRANNAPEDARENTEMVESA